MEAAERVTSYCVGAGFGAAIAMLVGFGVGGWMTVGRIDDRESEFARAEVIAAIVPYCIDRARNDPNFHTTLARIKKAGHSNGVRILVQAGWALKPTSEKTDYGVANECMKSLANWD
jgi:hypothetical protein